MGNAGPTIERMPEYWSLGDTATNPSYLYRPMGMVSEFLYQIRMCQENICGSVECMVRESTNGTPRIAFWQPNHIAIAIKIEDLNKDQIEYLKGRFTQKRFVFVPVGVDTLIKVNGNGEEVEGSDRYGVAIAKNRNPDDYLIGYKRVPHCLGYIVDTKAKKVMAVDSNHASPALREDAVEFGRLLFGPILPGYAVELLKYAGFWLRFTETVPENANRGLCVPLCFFVAKRYMQGIPITGKYYQDSTEDLYRVVCDELYRMLHEAFPRIDEEEDWAEYLVDEARLDAVYAYLWETVRPPMDQLALAFPSVVDPGTQSSKRTRMSGLQKRLLT